MNCETDFVSRNVKFQNLVLSLTKEMSKENQDNKVNIYIFSAYFLVRNITNENLENF